MMIILLNIDAGDQSEGHGVDKEAESLYPGRHQDPVLHDACPGLAVGRQI